MEPKQSLLIRSLRLASGKSLRELARQLQISPAHLCDIEHERRFPSIALLKRISTLLKIPFPKLQSLDSRTPIADIKRLAESDSNFSHELKALYAKWRDD